MGGARRGTWKWFLSAQWVSKVVRKSVIEEAAWLGKDGVCSSNRPELFGLFEKGTDRSPAARLDHALADKHLRAAEPGVANANHSPCGFWSSRMGLDPTWTETPLNSPRFSCRLRLIVRTCSVRACSIDGSWLARPAMAHFRLRGGRHPRGYVRGDCFPTLDVPQSTSVSMCNRKGCLTNQRSAMLSRLTGGGERISRGRREGLRFSLGEAGVSTIEGGQAPVAGE